MSTAENKKRARELAQAVEEFTRNEEWAKLKVAAEQLVEVAEQLKPRAGRW